MTTTQPDPNAPFFVEDHMGCNYRFSFGRASRFFRELKENARITGTRCLRCEVTYCPPKEDCPLCYGKAEWVEMPLTGTVFAYTIAHFATSEWVGKVPYVVAYVHLDGAATPLFQRIDMDPADLSFEDHRVHVGMRVKAVFKEQREGRITDFYFVPLEE